METRIYIKIYIYISLNSCRIIKTLIVTIPKKREGGKREREREGESLRNEREGRERESNRKSSIACSDVVKLEIKCVRNSANTLDSRSLPLMN